MRDGKCKSKNVGGQKCKATNVWGENERRRICRRESIGWGKCVGGHKCRVWCVLGEECWVGQRCRGKSVRLQMCREESGGK